MNEGKITDFIQFVKSLKGSERSEDQVFLNALFRLFGHADVNAAGASFEYRVAIDGKPGWVDLFWPDRVLIEMKSRGVDLSKYVSQARAYWLNIYGNRPQYVVLCNFDEFWVYDWSMQAPPLDQVGLEDLPRKYPALAFLAKEEQKPFFGNDLVAVTQRAARDVALLYRYLCKRDIPPVIAQRFTLQCLVCLFAEDTGLFPRRNFFYELIKDCLERKEQSYDLFRLLFEEMNKEGETPAGRFRGVDYFNGGIFRVTTPVELTVPELELLLDASKHDWQKVQPSIFGNIFETSLEDRFRHTLGAHYTHESDIMLIIEPTIIRPWRRRINQARSLKQLFGVWEEMSQFRILDPACGSGNFLYLAFRELKSLELDLLRKMVDEYPSVDRKLLHSKIKGTNFYGIDLLPFPVELAKVTLSMAKELAAEKFKEFNKQLQLAVEEKEEALPFDNLDENIIAADALKVEWPDVDAIIGNPPYMSKNKMQQEFSPGYMEEIRKGFPGMPGRADYCVYWFRKAHDHLGEGERAGLVGTNTIRQTYSRVGGLDYILSNGGTILEAVSSMPWSGEAAVHVSVVNWTKGKVPKETRRLLYKYGNSPDASFEVFELDEIPSSLSHLVDVTDATSLAVNTQSKTCFQGQTHGHAGFLLGPEEAELLLKEEPKTKEAIFKFMTAEDLIGSIKSEPSRYIIDFQSRTIYQAKQYGKAFKIVESRVLPTREEAYRKEKERNEQALSRNPDARVNHHHENFYRKWWLLSYSRHELMAKLQQIPRYIACGQVTKRPVFDLIPSEIHPNAALMVFTFDDDYSYGILQSSYHWEWFTERCSTLTERYRYTSSTVYDSFPWPQWGRLGLTSRRERSAPSSIVEEVSEAARELRHVRDTIRAEGNLSLRDVYRAIELPGENPLKDAHAKLDRAVAKAYLWGLPAKGKKMGRLELLLYLNQECAKAEKEGKPLQPPGRPQFP